MTSGIELIEFAVEQERDDTLLRIWLSGYNQQESFSSFKARMEPPRFKTDEEVLDDAQRILSSFTI